MQGVNEKEEQTELESQRHTQTHTQKHEKQRTQKNGLQRLWNSTANLYANYGIPEGLKQFCLK